ncbi:hypothetical protein OC846_001674 [Tilletia horrida]|uniref:Uncharacterized protein n=1 Tax=Tilletia horrida TaxID=155126 RepID=A0AAN6GUX2_9BASI|nr:hypothetical protein OC845_003817 [Tilletia horrida]KAK0555514.1 hypothetical protein OC846_001674 [Tilletia horrida]KAK0564386.1 hypothetical protein OC861_004326 [Tilletia horrida]
MSLFRQSQVARALLRSQAGAAPRSFAPASARAYTTASEEAAKGEKHNKSPEQLQKEHTPDNTARRGGKVTASPNEQPTQSEDAVHAEKQAGNKTPEQLQRETAGKA